MGMFTEDPRPRLDTGPDSRTKQSFKAECDIENIVAKYKKTGMVTHLAKGVPSFMDVSEVGSYREAIEQLRAATEYFGDLPAAVRAEFDNDPAEYVEFLAAGGALERLEEIQAKIYPPRKPAAGTEPPQPRGEDGGSDEKPPPSDDGEGS